VPTDLATGSLLERDAQLALLGELLEDTASGHGALALVEGSPGVGKSALLERAARMAREQGVAVLHARGHELERTFGWGVARSLFEPALGTDRDELLAGPAAQARVLFDEGDDGAGGLDSETGFSILHANYWLVLRLAERQPLLLVVDDAHWADEPSLRFLVYLAGRLSDQPIGVVVGTRSGELGEGGLLRQLAGEPSARVQALPSLGPAAVAELVRRRLPAADDELCGRCFELTAGNPLQLRELLAAMQTQPADAAALATAAEVAARSLARSVLRRLAALSPDARALARGVAVFEDDAPLHLAAELTGLASAAALAAADELARADVLRPGDPLCFTHPLVRAAVYGDLPFGERARTHRRAARLLVESGFSHECVSAHLLEAAPDGDAVVLEHLRATAQRAMERGAPASAVRYLERALREPPADAERAVVLAELGRAEAAAGLPDAVEHLQAAIGLAREPRQRAALLLAYGRVLQHSGRLSDACEAFQRGRDELGERHSELAVDLESGFLAAAMQAPDRAAAAHRHADEILAARRPVNRAELELASKAMVMRLWSDAPREEILATARRLFPDAAHDAVHESRALVHIAGCLSLCDDYAAAENALGQMFADARRRGSPSMFAAASQLRSRQRLWTGTVADAVLDARAAFDVWRGALHMYLHPAAYCLVSALLEQDELDEAERALALGDREPAAVGFFAAWRHTALGRLAVRRGDDGAALEAFLGAGRHLDDLLATNPTVVPWRSEAGLAAQRLGRHEEARSLIADELALAERFGAPRAIGVARRAAALLERGDAAVERLRSAVEPLAGCGARVEQARTQIELGAAIRRAGRATEARGTLREALVLAEAVGATALARRSREELRLAGGRAPAHVDPSGDGLTPSERRIAELAGAGQTNRQIADALFITAKSVEWHLSNVYRKLDIRGRTQLP
jgi:DNA-binding CsgD family transcriptional regulator/tetratricopeptide (TPR) repeat protein